jgi:cytochrome o ubiquinol oxidase operon protein cyoD
MSGSDASPAHTSDPGGNGSHASDHEEGAFHATLKDYLTGLTLAAILTVIPFWLVMGKVLSSSGATITIILTLAVVQIVVHVIYFLHMSTKSERGWSFLALIFTLVLVVIALAGSLWVMYHLNQNMMPVSTEQMRNMP